MKENTQKGEIRMTKTPTNRIVKKLALLAVLAASFAYLRQPEPAFATDTCLEECQDALDTCDSMCGGNKFCLDHCAAVFGSCLRNCR
jgi:hypothetical protein